MQSYLHIPIVFSALIVAVSSCSLPGKISKLRKNAAPAALSVGSSASIPADATEPSSLSRPDTIKVVNVDGKDMYLMSVVKDDDGNMVASQTLEAAVVQARFRNVAERGGKVDIGFRITVPGYMRDRNWQLRYTPVMYVMQDSLTLERLVVTGDQYRRRQLKGYQQYQRFIDSIITDSTAFIDRRSLEIFIRRNIPELYAMRSDSSIVDETRFASVFGVGRIEALDHYTNHVAEYFNERRKGLIGKKFRQYVKAPILSEGVRLDTVMRDAYGNYTYDYTQTVHTRPGMRKVEIVLDGEVYEQDNLLHRIPRSEPLAFFISSLSSLVDPRPRYMDKVVERMVTASASYNIEFESGSAAVKSSLGSNSSELARIENRLRTLSADDGFRLDSVSVVASCSPEGPYAVNSRLARRRAEAISSRFNSFMKHLADSLRRERAVNVNLDESYDPGQQEPLHVCFSSRHIAEDWDGLDVLVESDTVLRPYNKAKYFSHAAVENPDERENAMKREFWYPYMRKNLYPVLRRVQFRFALSRRGMVKDTIHTFEPDTLYMSGVEAIRNRDYAAAAGILGPYSDFNTAVACLALDRNHTALQILQNCDPSAEKEYMMAIIHSRLGDEEKAVQHYLDACSMNHQFVHRGNLDPEVSVLIKKYNLFTILNTIL